MIELTEGQAFDDDEIPIVINPRTKNSYVLVRKDVFDRIKGLLYDDGEWAAEEQLRLLAESGKRAGWDEPGTEDYDSYDGSERRAT